MKLFYLTVSVLIGMILILESYLLFKHKGQFMKSKRVAVISGIESLWVLFTVYALFTVPFNALEVLIPSALLVYSVLGWLYASNIISSSMQPETLRALVLPRWAMIFSSCFGVVFTLSCLYVLSLL